MLHASQYALMSMHIRSVLALTVSNWHVIMMSTSVSLFNTIHLSEVYKRLCDSSSVMPLSTRSTPPHLHCSDVICDFPLRDMLAYHKKKGAEGTILVTKVGSQRCCNCIHVNQGLSCVARHSKNWLATVYCQGMCAQSMTCQHYCSS